jgi:hypothetical protein
MTIATVRDTEEVARGKDLSWGYPFYTETLGWIASGER